MRVNGPALRAIRRDRGVTLQQVAQSAGISQAYLSRLERSQRGTAWVSDATVEAIAAALSMPLEAIVSTGSAA